MKRTIILLISVITIISCSKKENSEANLLSPEAKKTESINIVRKKMNDSIAILNEQNNFGDLSGTHQLKFSSDETSAFSGTASFEKTGRDLYDLTGNAHSGKNTLEIKGSVKRVSEKHLNFEGIITQKINGTTYIRSKKTTFFDEGKGKFWRLQNKINDAGFVDYIDIYF
jgi:hypothetical protein